MAEDSTFPQHKEFYFEKKHFSQNFITADFITFTFLNETHNLSDIGWDNPTISKLWRYNLHYFGFLLQDLNSKVHFTEQLNMITYWIKSNPFGKGTAWEPYPTSLRIINWIKWNSIGHGLSEVAKQSLWNQTKWLAARPEYHLLGNHLFINAKALFFSSAFFQLGEDSKIYKKAISILIKELDEQFLADGAHFELSPMYHALALEDLLDLFSISEYMPLSFPKAEIEKKVIKGMDWLRTMVYKNEELAHFNDCANGIAPKLSELQEYATRLGLNLSCLEEQLFNYHNESGFIVFNNLCSHLIADVGHVGPDYLPGHAHADTLSFELAINDNRMIVNSGTSVYGASEERVRQRGTAAHSTVEIDNHNSSEIWSGFRVARRAKPFDIQINSNDLSINSISFSASHDGFTRLRNSPIHNRSWSFNGNTWIVEDTISGNKNYVTSRFYFHPEIQIEKSEEGYLISKNNQSIAMVKPFGVELIEITDTTYHDEFGVCKSNQCLEIKAVSPCRFGIKIELI
jgi:uncharacterized heparinase superfamily protein